MNQMKDRVKRIPIESLKENNEHSDPQKPLDAPTGAELKPKTNEDLNAENPTRQGRRQATEEELNNPLHGVKLAEILERLVAHYGWEYMAERVKIRCFSNNPSMKSSLGFLRKTKWARVHVEDVYLDMLEEIEN
tara:strand:- start:1637 stop:2038 length:402 start_codon:yes stop_codon:yes gene_type:complete